MICHNWLLHISRRWEHRGAFFDEESTHSNCPPALLSLSQRNTENKDNVHVAAPTSFENWCGFQSRFSGSTFNPDLLFFMCDSTSDLSTTMVGSVSGDFGGRRIFKARSVLATSTSMIPGYGRLRFSTPP